MRLWCEVRLRRIRQWPHLNRCADPRICPIEIGELCIRQKTGQFEAVRTGQSAVQQHGFNGQTAIKFTQFVLLKNGLEQFYIEIGPLK